MFNAHLIFFVYLCIVFLCTKGAWGGLIHISNISPWQVWQEIQQITNLRAQNSTAIDSSITLLELNSFFACFEATTQQSATTPSQPPASSSQPLTVQVHELQRMPSRVNTRKNLYPKVFLRRCSGPVLHNSGLHHNFQPIPDTVHHPILPEVLPP